MTATYNGAQGTNNIRRFDYDAGGPVAPAGIAEGDVATITIEVIAD